MGARVWLALLSLRETEGLLLVYFYLCLLEYRPSRASTKMTTGVRDFFIFLAHCARCQFLEEKEKKEKWKRSKGESAPAFKRTSCLRRLPGIPFFVWKIISALAIVKEAYLIAHYNIKEKDATFCRTSHTQTHRAYRKCSNKRLWRLLNMSEPKEAIISLFKSSAARFVLNEVQH